MVIDRDPHCNTHRVKEEIKCTQDYNINRSRIESSDRTYNLQSKLKLMFFSSAHLSMFCMLYFEINKVASVKILCKNMDGINSVIRAQGSKFWGKWGSGIKIKARK